jgi:hypothetical protein
MGREHTAPDDCPGHKIINPHIQKTKSGGVGQGWFAYGKPSRFATTPIE